MCIQRLHHVRLIVTPWTIARGGLLCPRDFPVMNTGMGCHFLLQGIILNPGTEPTSSAFQADSLPLNHQGSQQIHTHMCVCVSVVGAYTVFLMYNLCIIK